MDSVKKIKNAFIFLAAFSIGAFAAEDFGRYFDCWMENADHVSKSEVQRLGIQTYGVAWICGCFTMEESSGEDWLEGEMLTHISRVWDLPGHLILPCKSKACSDTSEAFNQSLDVCVDFLNSSSFTLAAFSDSGKVRDAVARKFADNGKLTPFGQYFEDRKNRLDSIQCFFQYHERPDAPRLLDWNRKGVFSISGLPERLLPDAVGRFTDYSDVRCKDGNVWSGFLANGYLENEMSVDANGKFHGRETGYGNDPTLPVRQGKEFGKVLFTTDYVHGVKNGVSKFYRYSAVDNLHVDAKAKKKMKSYYFLHLEVPYKMGAVHGMVNMFSQKGFLMAEIPYWNNEIHGRATVHYPFVEDDKAKKKKSKKKTDEEDDEAPKIKDKISIDFKHGKLNGPNDLGYSFGTYRDGLLEGKYMTFDVNERCYEWIPLNGIEGTDPERSNRACYIEKLEKKSWGTFHNGELQGLMECANGIKGKENVDCDHAY